MLEILRVVYYIIRLVVDKPTRYQVMKWEERKNVDHKLYRKSVIVVAGSAKRGAHVVDGSFQVLFCLVLACRSSRIRGLIIDNESPTSVLYYI